MDITISIDKLAELLEKSAELALMKAGVAGPSFLSRNQLVKIYGYSWVNDRIESGKIQGTRRGSAKNSVIKFDAAHVRAVWDAEQVATIKL